MIELPHDQRTWADLDLRMAAQAKIAFPLMQEFGADRAVRRVADRATFTKRFVLERERAALIAMTARTGLIHPGHGQTTGWFENIAPVRVMALHAIHPAFGDRMMVRQVELGVR